MYAYTTTSAAGHTFSPECAWEEWHAALDENAPEGMDLNAQGVCCHTHQTIVVDSMDDAPEATEAPTTTLSPLAASVVKVIKGGRIARSMETLIRTLIDLDHFTAAELETIKTTTLDTGRSGLKIRQAIHSH